MTHRSEWLAVPTEANVDARIAKMLRSVLSEMAELADYSAMDSIALVMRDGLRAIDRLASTPPAPVTPYQCPAQECRIPFAHSHTPLGIVIDNKPAPPPVVAAATDDDGFVLTDTARDSLLGKAMEGLRTVLDATRNDVIRQEYAYLNRASMAVLSAWDDRRSKQPAEAKCPRCEGHGRLTLSAAAPDSWECVECHGTGHVPTPRPDWIPTVEIFPLEGELRIWSLLVRLTGEKAARGVPIAFSDGICGGSVGVNRDGKPVHVSLILPERPYGHLEGPRPAPVDSTDGGAGSLKAPSHELGPDAEAPGEPAPSSSFSPAAIEKVRAALESFRHVQGLGQFMCAPGKRLADAVSSLIGGGP